MIVENSRMWFDLELYFVFIYLFVFQKGLCSQLNVEGIGVGVIDFSAVRKVCVL